MAKTRRKPFIMEKYADISKTLEIIHGQHCGLTWNLHRGNVLKIASLRTLSFVGVVSVFPERGRVLAHSPTERDFLQFILDNQPMLTTPATTWLCVGSWYDSITHHNHLDLSRVSFDRHAAHRLAWKHRQYSIYLLHMNESETPFNPDDPVNKKLEDGTLYTSVLRSILKWHGT